jgi:hypothetical protein
MKSWHPSLMEIKKKPQLREYFDIAKEFVYYLDYTSGLNVRLDGIRFDREVANDFQAVRKEIPYIHRWTEPYLKSRLAKGYLLDEWYRNDPKPVTLLTYTTYHDYLTYKQAFPKKVNEGHTIESTFDDLKKGFRHSTMMIRKIKGYSPPYLCMYEPHPESGYPHIHCPFFTDFSQGEMRELREHWSKDLELGSFEKGLKFDEGTTFKRGELISIKNYILKYMKKTLYDGWKDWTPEELVFNAVARKKCFRTFQPSRELSRVMAPVGVIEDRPGYTHVRTSIVGKNMTAEAPRWVIDHPGTVMTWDTHYAGEP